MARTLSIWTSSPTTSFSPGLYIQNISFRLNICNHFCSANADFGLKIIDFGLARRLDDDGRTDVKELQVPIAHLLCINIISIITITIIIMIITIIFIVVIWPGGLMMRVALMLNSCRFKTHIIITMIIIIIIVATIIIATNRYQGTVEFIAPELIDVLNKFDMFVQGTVEFIINCNKFIIDLTCHMFIY